MRHATRRDHAGFSGASSQTIARRFRRLVVLCTGLTVAPAAGGALAAGWDTGDASRSPAIQWHQDGQASYYGTRWNGRRTSSGERFDPRKLTAAHASLPLGTRLLVTCESSGESVVVTVNDREPDHGDRIIDLSPAAARRLHMIGSGVADVEISEATDRDVRDQQLADSRTSVDGQAADGQDNEVAEAPDDADDQDVATPEPHRASHPRHVRSHRHHARR